MYECVQYVNSHKAEVVFIATEWEQVCGNDNGAISVCV